MAETDERIKALRSTRADYDAEVAWHRFLLDAVCGTGGFKGKVGPTAISYLGWAAEAYARDTTATLALPQTSDSRLSYLDQFPREDEKKFSARIDVSHYVNYTGPLGEIFLAYVNKETFNRDKLGERLLAWMQDVDGQGTTWDRLQHNTIRPRAALLGWCPVLYDKPRAPQAQGELSQAQAEQLGVKTRAVPLFPVNILDWIHDQAGLLEGVKIRTDHVVRANLMEPPKREEHYSLWYRDRVERWVVTVDADGNESVGSMEKQENPFGRIPLVAFRAATSVEDNIRGPSIVGDIALVNRRIFNTDSELVDHIRGQVFAVLGVPVQDMKQNVGELVAGSGNAIKIPMDSKVLLHYAAPPASVAATIEKHREVLVREIYRITRVEYAKPTGVTTSGIARAYEFEQTNRKLSGIAKGFAEGEQASLRLVAELEGGKAPDLTVKEPTDFSVEDMATDIDNVIQANQVRLGTTAEGELRKRLVRRMLPNLPAATAAKIEEEIDQMGAQAEQDQALEREVRNAALTDPPDDESVVPGDDIEDETEET